MKKVQLRLGATALTVVISLSTALPAFAGRDDREPRDVRERVVRIIAKIKNILHIGTNDDGLSIPKP